MIPYGLPLIYFTLACDPAPSVRLFLLPLSPRQGGHSKRKRHIMTTKTLNKSDLAQFTGSENWHRHGINRTVLYTTGAQPVSPHAGPYRLLAAPPIIQPHNKHS